MTANFLSIAGMLLTAIGFIAWSRLQLGKVWLALLIGGGLWIVAVALKFAWAIPINVHVYTGLRTALGVSVGDAVFFLYVGLLTGVFECGLLYLAVRFIPWLNRFDSNRALALGYGFGAIEALVIGLAALIPTLMVLYMPGTVSPTVAANVKPLDWAIMPAATVERIGTIFVHGFTTYLIVYAVLARQIRWFWVAFLFKSAIDVVAVWGQLSFGLGSAAHIWTLEAIVVAFAVVSVWGIVIFRRRWAEVETGGTSSSHSGGIV